MVLPLARGYLYTPAPKPYGLSAAEILVAAAKLYATLFKPFPVRTLSRSHPFRFAPFPVHTVDVTRTIYE